MTATENDARLAELARLGDYAYYTKVVPKLRPEDAEKYVAVDVDTGEYEADDNDSDAIDRLLDRLPSARIWMMQVGHAAAYRIRGGTEGVR